MIRRKATLALIVALLLPSIGSAAPQIFADDFNRTSLGPDWAVDSGSYITVSDALAEVSGSRYLDAQMRYVADATDSPDQFGKLRIVSAASHTFGFIFRAAATPGDHYEVHLPFGTSGWRWERYDPGFVERMGECTGDADAANGDWIGATIEGSGSTTTVSLYRWDSDPDLGASVNISANWGSPDCIITDAPGPTYVDTGDHVGIRSYTGKSKSSGFADDWAGGDVSAASSICGDSILEGAEQCDDGNLLPDDGCRADCTLELCGDGLLDAIEACDDGNNVSGDGCRDDCSAEICGDGFLDAGEACDDGNTLPGDGCDASCSVEVPVTCGDGVLDGGLGEECDDGNTLPGDGCRADCTEEICGDGFLDLGEACDDGNNLSGDGCRADCSEELCGDLILDAAEQCEVDSDCGGGESCVACGCAPPGTSFFDEFDRASLGPEWSLDAGTFALVGNQLGQTSGQRYTNAQLRYVGGSTSTPDQFGKLRVTSAATHTFGFLFRSGATPGDHYQVHTPNGSSDWRWERHDPGFVERMADCVGDQPVSDGDWIGATISGSGSATLVEVFRWNADPDAGGPVSIDNWGSPDCIMTGAPGPSYVNAGNYLGVRAYTGNSSQNGFADSWSGGDLLAVSATCGDGVVAGIEECDDGNPSTGDGCRPDCTSELCGDGVVDPGEACDDGNGSTGDGCRPDCSAELCGDGTLDVDEECDDGNLATGDGCDASCLIEPPPGCGDGFLDPGESCDDGNNLPGDGCRADCSDEVCGDSILDPLEECDDGNNSPDDGCRADCSLELCGDGVLDLLEECDDGNNSPGDGCRADCSDEVCGDGVLDVLEECDDGNNSPGDGCRADCSSEVCGDGLLDLGEECESDGDCGGGDACVSCACGPPIAEFADDFNRASLGPNWSVDSGSYSLSANQLRENSGQRYRGTQLRYLGGTSVTPDQYGKLQVITPATHTFGFIFRAGASPGDHYEVHLPGGTTEWRWERYDPDFVERMGQCSGGANVGDGDWIGAAIVGSGASTEVLVWRWDVDPDAGGAPDILGNWGPPHCTMGTTGLVFVDAGPYLGIRAYTGGRSSPGTADNWFAGDFDGQVTVAPPSNAERILSNTGSGSPGSLRDPDGIVVDSAGNIYVAACGSGPQDEGVWKIDSAAVVTKILGNSGDGSAEASCPVGLALDSQGNLYAACFLSDNVFQISPGGAVSEIIGAAGAGPGARLEGAIGVAVSASDEVYATGYFSHNVLVRRSDSSVEETLNSSDGLVNPFGIVVDSAENAFVASFGSDQVYRVSAGGSVDVVIDASAGGVPGGLGAPHAMALDSAENLYVTGNSSDNVLKRTTTGTISVILDSTGDGGGNPLDNPTGIAVDTLGNVYVAAFGSNNLFQVTPAGVATELLDQTGDGVNEFYGPSDFCVAVDSAGAVYTTGTLRDNTFRVYP